MSDDEIQEFKVALEVARPFETTVVTTLLDRYRLRDERDYREAVGIMVAHIAWGNKGVSA